MTDARGGGHPSPLAELLEDAGGVPVDYHGRTLVRHFGDPAAEYRAATEGAALFDRSHRTRLVVRGRAPAQMLNGILTGTLPAAPAVRDGDVLEGAATYHAVLTPKGKMITDLWALRLGDEAADGFLLDVPVAGAAPLLAHLAKVLPPRFAAVEDASERTAMITLAGPEAARLVSRLALGLRVEAAELEALEEGAWRAAVGSGGAVPPAGVGATGERPPGSEAGATAAAGPSASGQASGPSASGPASGPSAFGAGAPGPSASGALVVQRTEEVWPPAFSVVGPAGAVGALWRALIGAGARPAGLGPWNTLRVEAGRPAFGTDMDERTIPIEAGIDARAIDHRKGCYTGQEVIVRIRDRGHVNRHLRRLELGEGSVPPPGTELFAAGGLADAGTSPGDAAEAPRDAPPKAVGWITSAVESPRFGGVVALAYVRREVERVRLEGRTVEVGPAA